MTARGASYDGLSVAELCAPISARREPEGLGWHEMGALALDPRAGPGAAQRAAQAVRRAQESAGRSPGTRRATPGERAAPRPWSPEELDRLALMQMSGAGAGDIARELGRSRAAVAGKMHRLGLHRRLK